MTAPPGIGPAAAVLLARVGRSDTHGFDWLLTDGGGGDGSDD